MSQKSTQSSTANSHPNQPSAQAQTVQPGSMNSLQISSERKKYLAAQYQYSPEQVDVIRSQICLSATDTELEFFLATCRRVKLDPFARQIYFIKRPQRIENAFGDSSWVDVGKPETSIDGLRASAEQTGDYEGQGPLMWCDEDGKWTDVWLKKTPPHAAKATINRKGHREPMVNVALFSEFCPVFKNGKSPAMWQKMPANQLAKCAEAGGLRRAFPRDLSGLYIDVEMEHASASATYSAPEPAAAKTAAAPPPVIEAASVEVKSESASGEHDELSSLRAIIANAKTRADLAPVGKRVSDAKDRKDDLSAAIREQIKPEMEIKWRTLPPASTSRTTR